LRDVKQQKPAFCALLSCTALC